MPRKLFFKAPYIEESDLVIGNHDNVMICVYGDFRIKGLIHCPGYTLSLTIVGDGSITLHGICKRLEIRRISGNCIVNLDDLSTQELACLSLMGNSLLKVGSVKYISQRNVGPESALIIGNKLMSPKRDESISDDTYADNGLLTRRLQWQ